jgi:hypothetical protein
MAGKGPTGNRRNLRNLGQPSWPELLGISNGQELGVEAKYLNGGCIFGARVDYFIFTIAELKLPTFGFVSTFFQPDRSNDCFRGMSNMEIILLDDFRLG